MKASYEVRRMTAKIADGRLPEDEPVFVLRARDRFAATIIRSWARLVDAHGGPEEKVRGANAIADEMEEWPTKQTPGMPLTRSTRPVEGNVVKKANGSKATPKKPVRKAG